MQTSHLPHKYMHTLERIFQHPVSHNLEWKDVVALVEHLGAVHEDENGRMTFTLNGVSEHFARTHDKKDVSEVQQVMDLRRFLEGAGVGKDGSIAGGRAEGGIEATHGAEPERHGHDEGHRNAERNQRAEQELKTQQDAQNDRNAFPKGLAQEHTKGHS